MRTKYLTSLMIISLGFSLGCHRDLPKPDKKPKSVARMEIRLPRSEILSVYNPNSDDFPSLFVRHRIQGTKVFVECLVTGISFRQTEESHDRKGKMVVWIDGKKSHEVTQAAFIIKGIPPGSHKIKLEVVDLSNESYGLSNEFLVKIPN